MPWTHDQKISGLMRLPWTVQVEAADDPGEIVVRISELPGMIVIGTAAEVEKEFWPALKASLECCLQFGDENSLPLPPSVSALPWNAKAAPSFALGLVVKPAAPSGASLTAFSQPFAPA